LRNYIEQNIEKTLAPLVGGNNENDTGIIIEWLQWHDGNLIVHVWEKKIGRDELGSIRSEGPVDGGFREAILLKGSKGWLITCRLLTACVVQNPSFTSYIAPYLFAFFAIALGVYNTL
jgi:hypothetical protein